MKISIFLQIFIIYAFYKTLLPKKKNPFSLSHGIGVPLIAIVRARNLCRLSLVLPIRRRGRGQSCSRLPRSIWPAASRRPTALQILVVHHTVPRGTGESYSHVFGNREEVVVRHGLGRQHLIGVGTDCGCEPQWDAALLSLLGLAALPVLPELQLQLRAHRREQTDQNADKQHTDDEEQNADRNGPE